MIFETLTRACGCRLAERHLCWWGARLTSTRMTAARLNLEQRRLEQRRTLRGLHRSFIIQRSAAGGCFRIGFRSCPPSTL